MKTGKFWAFLILSFISITSVFAEDSPQELNKPSHVLINSTDKKGYDIISDGEVIGKEGQEKEAQESNNMPPILESLTPDLASPQEVGTSIIWKAKAEDPEDDPIYYRFMLQGPSTDGKVEVVRDWDTIDSWSWNIDEKDVGSSKVTVLIKDDFLQDDFGFEDFKTYEYQILAKQFACPGIQVASDVYTPSDPKIVYCDENGYFAVRNRIYLTGQDLDRILKVKYILHPSFQNNEVVTEDSMTNFEIQISAWGRFNLIAEVTTKDGQLCQIPYYLTFKEKVQEAQRIGIPLVRSCTD